MDFYNQDVKEISNVEEISFLLAECELIYSDIQQLKSLRFFGIYSGKTLAGIIGIETYNEISLLRSLAVSKTFRAKGLATKLVNFAENFALTHQIKQLYLLTTTTNTFFNKLGYEVVSREIAPKTIQATTQFTKLCPSTAVLMSKILA